MPKPINTSTARVDGKALLWTAIPRNLRPPKLLWSAATAADVGAWRTANTWADATELVLFQAEHEDDIATIGSPFQAQHASVPWRVLGPTISRKALEAVYRRERCDEATATADGIPPDVAAFDRYGLAARTILRTRSKIAPQWTVCANADGGALAVWAAACHGRHVAIASGPPSNIAVVEAVKHGVSILVATKSDDHRFNLFRDDERLKHG